jgi:hypothetical protein
LRRDGPLPLDWDFAQRSSTAKRIAVLTAKRIAVQIFNSELWVISSVFSLFGQGCFQVSFTAGNETQLSHPIINGGMRRLKIFAALLSVRSGENAGLA